MILRFPNIARIENRISRPGRQLSLRRFSPIGCFGEFWGIAVVPHRNIHFSKIKQPAH